MARKVRDDDNPISKVLSGLFKNSVDPSKYVQYTGVPQDKGSKSMPGYKSNYQNTPSPSKSTQSDFGILVTPSAPKKKPKGKSGGGRSQNYVD